MNIEENTQYHAVQATLDTLNDNVKSEKDKYFTTNNLYTH